MADAGAVPVAGSAVAPKPKGKRRTKEDVINVPKIRKDIILLFVVL